MTPELPPSVEQTPRPGWRQRLRSLLLVVLCFELGVFLLVFPWLQDWDVNWFASSSHFLGSLWTSDYFRGALSGLGLIDLYISLSELVRMRRFRS